MDVTGFQEALLSWYSREARVLPWRSDPVPYNVWISEMMLQQTRVDTVIPYYGRFIERYPSVSALAGADDEELLKVWQGLGYYRRAMNLKKAAQRMCLDFGGSVPDNPTDLMALPGIGRYSAGAIASIAFGRKVAAVDGNALRVMARLTADAGDITSPPVHRRLAEFVEHLLPEDRIGDFNQALMELGALICLPNGEPLCARCPVRAFCLARRAGTASSIPVRTVKEKRRIERRTVFVLMQDGLFALRQRPDAGLLPGLWEFPHMEGHLSAEQSREALEKVGLHIIGLTPLSPAKHIFSHLEWHMTGYSVQVTGKEVSGNWIWATPMEIRQRFSIPAAFRAFLPEDHVSGP